MDKKIPPQTQPLVPTVNLISPCSISQQTVNLVPMDVVNGFEIRPGFYDINGAMAIPCGVNFTIYSHNATSIQLVLFKNGEHEPYAIIPFPAHYRTGKVYSMIVFGLKIDTFEYAYRVDGPYDPKNGLIFNPNKYLLDPYAKAVAGQRQFGKARAADEFYKARVVRDNFDWGGTRPPLLHNDDLIIYEMHVRGFTNHTSSGVQFPGSFQAIIEKIPHLVELGINVVELMPVFEFDETLNYREYKGKPLYEYWGYNTVCFFAPNTAYASGTERNQEGNELKKLIKALHENGIEVYLDVVFNHTAEGNEHGPFFSFKGFDNNIYYLLTPDGYYQNFSGCGNSFNCNHPTVQRMIIDCLRYWVTSYHVDGFRFDLASILGRSEDGTPLPQPPLLRAMAFDTILADTRLIAEAWDAAGLYQVGHFPSWNRWAEWNGKYRDDLRKFLKGDAYCADIAAKRMIGSPDLYDPQRGNASVNFITCHDGFTLYDLYAYNQKHNMENGWNNTDGSNDDNSWNCGAEGATKSTAVNALRLQMMKNAIAVLLCSRGTPMFLAGDEFGNTQYGNNNSYCQDNKTSWLDWRLLQKNRKLFEFFKRMISFRKQHRCLRTNISNGFADLPDTSFHGSQPFVSYFLPDDHYIGVMFAGKSCNSRADIVYVAVNTYWEEVCVTLPNLPPDFHWELTIRTDQEIAPSCLVSHQQTLPPRTVMIFVAQS